MNWIFVIIIVVVFYIIWEKYLASVSGIENYHNPIHYNKQKTPDIENYEKLTIVPRSPNYRGY